MNLKEVCKYTGWGMTKVREIARSPDNNFVIRCDNRYYFDKTEFDNYLTNCMKYQITI